MGVDDAEDAADATAVSGTAESSAAMVAWEPLRLVAVLAEPSGAAMDDEPLSDTDDAWWLGNRVSGLSIDDEDDDDERLAALAALFLLVEEP